MAVQDVDVSPWGGGSHLRLTASANPEKGTLMPRGSYPLDFFRPVTLLVPISLSGSVSLSMDIDLEVPRLDVFDQTKVPLKVELPFSCLEDGNIEIRRKGKVCADWDYPLSLELEIYTWQDNLLGWPPGTVPAPSSIRVMHIVAVAWLDRLDRRGARCVTVENGQANDVPHDIRPGLTGPRTAVLGPLIIELVQPVSKVWGLEYRVLFDVDSSKIDQDRNGHRRDDGDQLDKFIHEGLLSPYEVRVALDSGLLPVRGEARASVAYRGNAADRIRYNQQLSEKRKAAMVDWLTRKGVPNMNTNRIEAVGDSKALSNEEDPQERRCQISIDGRELAWAVQQLWLANRYLNR